MAPRKVSIEELEKWPSVKDVAEELGRSRQGIRNMLASRDLTGIRTRIGWLIDPASPAYERAKREAALRKADQISHETHEDRR